MRIRVVAVLAVAALAVAACSNSTSKSGGSNSGGSGNGSANSQPGVTKDTIRTAGVASITNPLNAPYGDLQKGVQAYYNMVNKSGGIYGRKLVFVKMHDDQVGNNSTEVQAMLDQDNIFAAVGMATIASFSGAKLLAQQNVPTFGWNINDEWAGPKNFFGNVGAECNGCVGGDLPYFAQQLGKKKVAVLAYNVANSKLCAQGIKKSFDKYPTAKVVVYDDTLSFGDQSFVGPSVRKMKDNGVDLVMTCMDTNAVLAIGKQMKQDGVNAIQYLPNAYDHDFLKQNSQFFQGSIVRIPFAPFESTAKPQGLSDYLKWMKKSGYTPSEYTTYGWINASMLYDGLKAAGPDFTRQKVIDALNKMTHVDANGLAAFVDWTIQHTEKQPPLTCAAYVKIQGSKFVPTFVPNGKNFACTTKNFTPDDKPSYQ
jgi:ABC-type branched-subunit amino acid transport system substrate-binding protein